MTEKRIHDLTDTNTTPADTDYMVTDAGGDAESQKMLLSKVAEIPAVAAADAAAQAAAEATAAAALSAHEADTTGVHGITDTAALLTDADVLDEDDMVSNSSAHVPTQQSVKAYVDEAVAAGGGGGGASALDDLTDVTITAAAAGDILRHNGTNWVDTPGTDHYEAAGAVSTHAAVASGVHGISAFGATLVDDADAATARTTLGVVIGTDVQAYDADTLKADTADTLTAGFDASDYAAGTQSSGTYTPNPANGNFQVATNGGAHTLAPPSTSCTIVVHYTNNGSAGTITTSGFTVVNGDSFTTTDTHEFLCYITKINDVSHLNVVALQ